jgi:hypothetical protein
LPSGTGYFSSAFHGLPTGTSPTASYTAPIHPLSFYGPANDHPSANQGGNSPIEHFIPADPDEEDQPQTTGTMAIPAGVPYGAIQASYNFNHLATRESSIGCGWRRSWIRLPRRLMF